MLFRLVEALLGLVFPAPSTTTTTTEPTTTTTTTTAAPCGGVLGKKLIYKDIQIY